MRIPIVSAAALLVVAGGAAAAPHAAWIDARGGVVRLAPGAPVGDASLVPAGEAVLHGGGSAAGVLKLPGPGASAPLPAGIAWLRHETTVIRLLADPDDFDSFLAEEGLDDALLWRTSREQDEVPGAAFVVQRADAWIAEPGRSAPKSSKGLGLRATVGEGDSSGARRAVVTVSLDGAPVAGAQVVARSPDDSLQLIDATTGPDGTVGMRLAPGTWILTTAHASEEPDENETWMIRLASLAFAIAAEPRTPAE